jgi:hypothetical protein
MLNYRPSQQRELYVQKDPTITSTNLVPPYTKSDQFPKCSKKGLLFLKEYDKLCLSDAWVPPSPRRLTFSKAKLRLYYR